MSEYVQVSAVYADTAIDFLQRTGELRLAAPAMAFQWKGRTNMQSEFAFDQVYLNRENLVVALARDFLGEYESSRRVHLLHAAWFRDRRLIVENPVRRRITGTEYEMLCRKIEAMAAGRQDLASDIQLPPWTQGLYDRCIKDGVRSFRGRTGEAQFTQELTFQSSVMPGGLVEVVFKGAHEEICPDEGMDESDRSTAADRG